MIKYILFIKPLRYLYICIEKASMKLPASLRHDNDRLTVRNLACTVEYVSLIFTGATGITWHSPPASCAASPTSAWCSGLRRADRLKRPAMRARSFITSTLAILQSFQMSFNSKACYFFVNELCFPKTRRAILCDSPPGQMLSVTVPIFDY